MWKKLFDRTITESLFLAEVLIGNAGEEERILIAFRVEWLYRKHTE